jgi:hypothetical protein
MKKARVTAACSAIIWLAYSLWLVKDGWKMPMPDKFEVSNVRIQQAIACRKVGGELKPRPFVM